MPPKPPKPRHLQVGVDLFRGEGRGLSSSSLGSLHQHKAPSLPPLRVLPFHAHENGGRGWTFNSIDAKSAPLSWTSPMKIIWPVAPSIKLRL